MSTTIRATDASNRFGQLLDMARSEPVTIEKKGRPVAVVLAIEEFQRMEAELEHFADIRLQQSISDMDAGRTSFAEEALPSLKKRYQ